MRRAGAHLRSRTGEKERGGHRVAHTMGPTGGDSQRSAGCRDTTCICRAASLEPALASSGRAGYAQSPAAQQWSGDAGAGQVRTRVGAASVQHSAGGAAVSVEVALPHVQVHLCQLTRLRGCRRRRCCCGRRRGCCCCGWRSICSRRVAAGAVCRWCCCCCCWCRWRFCSAWRAAAAGPAGMQGAQWTVGTMHDGRASKQHNERAAGRRTGGQRTGGACG